MKTFFNAILLAWAVCFCSLDAMGQTYAVSGRVTEAKTRTAIPFASVQLLTADSVLYAVSFSDSEGAFQVRTDSAGCYRLRLAAVGYDAREWPVELTAGRDSVDVGAVALAASAMSQTLGEATVRGKASPLTVRKDTFVYSTGAMIVDEGAMLSHLIAQMPGVKMDKEGNLTWQGKKIESLLVNGKKFFGGDIQTALRDLPAEIVANLKVYDKKSDTAEKTGIDDGERTTVIDIGVKKEYQGTWTGNADVGGGYEDKWTGRAFLSRFSDRLQVAASGSANNLNGFAQVDENGNWYNSGFQTGWSTVRSGQVSAVWNNKDDKRSAGYQEVNASVRYNHDNTDRRTDTWQENYLPGTDRIWWNQRVRNWSAAERLNAAVGYSLNIDTLNFLNMNASYERGKDRSKGTELSATFSDDPQDHFADHPLDHVFGDDLPEAVTDVLVNTMDKRTLGDAERQKTSVGVSFTHRFRRTQHMVTVGVDGTYADNRGNNFAYYDGRYFTGGTSKDVQNQFIPNDDHGWTGSAFANLRLKVGRTLWLSGQYTFRYEQDVPRTFYYRMDGLPEWTDDEKRPFGTVPTDDERKAVGMDRNSRFRTDYDRRHQANATLSGTIGRMEVFANLSLYAYENAMHYARPEVIDTMLSKRRVYVSPSVRLKYKFSDRTSLQLSYSGYRNDVDLLSYLNIVDDSNPQSSSRGNPDLKDGWGNNYYMNFNTSVEKHELNFYVYAGGGNRRNGQTQVMEYNATTGYYLYYPVNVNGNWYLYGGGGFSMALDEQKAWHLDGFASNSYSQTVGYLSVENGKNELNTVKSNDIYVRLGLNFRREKFFARLGGMFVQGRYRSDMQPESDETNYTYQGDVTLSWTAPWGMTVGTDFTVYSRRKFLTNTMNVDQYIWNANIAQKFLKDKSLTLKLEGTDLLASRNGDTHYANAYSVNTIHSNTFQRYVVLHVIYNFKWGRKK